MTYLKIYPIVALLIAALFSYPSLSPIPLLLIGLYLYLWWRPINATIELLLNLFILFALAILFRPLLGLFSSLVPLPVLFVLYTSLLKTPELFSYQESRYLRRPTNICLSLFLITFLTLGASLILHNFSLSLTCLGFLIYLAALIGVVMRKLPLKPVEEAKVRARLIAGSKDKFQIKLRSKTKLGGKLFLKSPHEWLSIASETLSLREKELRVEISLSPPLSGPSNIKLPAQFIDQWGLIQTGFEVEPLELFVIPKAKYAAWLVRRYLEGGKPGTLPLVSSPGLFKATSGLRQGIEYYGSRLYQPGDSLKVIDWKHSLKLSELVAKEFSEFKGRSAMVLVNLAVTNAEEADKLGYEILMTAISLAQENIPTALAAYDHEKVRLTTSVLHPRALLLQSLELAQQIVTFVNPLKYLSPPNVNRLRANLSRLNSLDSEASKTLAQLLQLEYKSLEENAKTNPASQALLEGLAKVERGANLVIISRRNHDAEALAFNIFSLARRGQAIIEVEV